MIYWTLFLEFLKIGAFTFGGGYAMIVLIQEVVLENGWMAEERLLQMVALAESTPGPLAVNMATFVGASQGGLLGSLLATLGVVLPSFLVILLIAAILKNLMKYPAVQAVLSGIRPATVGLILATGVMLFAETLFGIAPGAFVPMPNVGGLVLMALLLAIFLLWKHFMKKEVSPILLIVISAVFGIIFM